MLLGVGYFISLAVGFGGYAWYLANPENKCWQHVSTYSWIPILGPIISIEGQKGLYRGTRGDLPCTAEPLYPLGLAGLLLLLDAAASGLRDRLELWSFSLGNQGVLEFEELDWATVERGASGAFGRIEQRVKHGTYDVVLFLAGYTSHKSVPLLKACKALGVPLVYLPRGYSAAQVVHAIQEQLVPGSPSGAAHSHV